MDEEVSGQFSKMEMSALTKLVGQILTYEIDKSEKKPSMCSRKKERLEMEN